MRSVYCSVLVLALAATLAGAPRGRRTPDGNIPQRAAGEPTSADFKIFVKGRQIGTEQVTVTKTAGGTVVAGSGSMAAPLDVVTNRCEVRYDAQWRPLEASVDAIVRGQYVLLQTVFADGTATTRATQAGKQGTQTAKVSADPVVLLNSFFGLYEVLAARLASMQPGSTLPAFVMPTREIAVEFKSVTEERIQSPARTIVTRHYVLSFMNPDAAMQVELWTDEHQRLVHLAVPAQSFDVLRSDIATVAARREVVSRAGDEPVKMAANGFSLAGTLSKPRAAKPGVRYPAVVLVPGSGQTDRDEMAFNIPIFAQLAGAIADAGFLVVRYDKRGVGQSGGRFDGATVEDYADDALSAVRYLRTRKDVDKDRIAMAGHSEGGWAAAVAAASSKDIDALVLIATPGVTGSELVLAQQQHVLDTMKVSMQERQAKIDLQKKIQKAVTTGTGWESIPPEMRKQADTPWFRSFLAFDPAKIVRRVRQPILIVQGDLDRQVFPAQADRLAQLARSRKAPADKQVTLVHVPGVNHLLAPATSGEYDEYAALPDKNVSKDVLSAIVSWLGQTLASKR